MTPKTTTSNTSKRSKLVRWYPLVCISGKEERVAEMIRELAARNPHFAASFAGVFVPKTLEIREDEQGEPRRVERPFLSGYVLVGLRRLNEPVELTLRSVKWVLGWANGSPVPLSDHELARLRSADKGAPSDEQSLVGKCVAIKKGPLSGFEGQVIEDSPAKMMVRLIVPIFGRDTEVEVRRDYISGPIS